MDPMSGKIVLVDDDVTSLALGKSILAPQYDIITIPSGEKLFILLERVQPTLILLDVEMPGMNGYDVLKKIKSIPQFVDIPVVFLTSRSDSSSELEGLNLGAIDYISKPFSPPLLLKRIELHLLIESQTKKLIDYNSNLQQMVKEKTKTVLDMQNSVLKTVANLVEHRDEITGGHVERTRGYLEILLDGMIGQKLHREELESWDRDFFLHSSHLHDVGKISIRDNVLLKPGKLSVDEFDVMKNHTLFGVQIIEEIQKNTPESSFLTYAKILAGTHHERWDGTGYPYGIKHEEIPLGGRLMAIADVYDALISERPYKAPLTHEQAVDIIMDGRETQFDPAITDIFFSVAGQFDRLVQEKNSLPAVGGGGGVKYEAPFYHQPQFASPEIPGAGLFRKVYRGYKRLFSG
ncbi:response regulator [Treponema primitia]|uniref:HD domain-containing phosphohydrolase n=1 Tax=Treponema primitia TaxID=88058 RepID=UPI00397FAF00